MKEQVLIRRQLNKLVSGFDKFTEVYKEAVKPVFIEKHKISPEEDIKLVSKVSWKSQFNYLDKGLRWDRTGTYNAVVYKQIEEKKEKLGNVRGYFWITSDEKNIRLNEVEVIV